MGNKWPSFSEVAGPCREFSDAAPRFLDMIYAGCIMLFLAECVVFKLFNGFLCMVANVYEVVGNL